MQINYILRNKHTCGNMNTFSISAEYCKIIHGQELLNLHVDESRWLLIVIQKIYSIIFHLFSLMNTLLNWKNISKLGFKITLMNTIRNIEHMFVKCWISYLRKKRFKKFLIHTASMCSSFFVSLQKTSFSRYVIIYYYILLFIIQILNEIVIYIFLYFTK